MSESQELKTGTKGNMKIERPGEREKEKETSLRQRQTESDRNRNRARFQT